MLAGAVVYDLRDRRVPNPWWVPFAALAAILAVGDFVAPDRDLELLGFRYFLALAVAGIMYLLWRLRLFGGADAKALMLLALLAPLPPSTGTPMQPAFDALANGSAFMLGVPVYFLAMNLARGDLVLPAALLGRQLPLPVARSRHVWPMQIADVDAPNGLRWRYWQRLAGDQAAEYAALERKGVTTVWVTPKVPFMLLLLFGWAAAWQWGNLLVQVALWWTR